MKSCLDGLPVRVLRSFKEKSAYAPTDSEQGIRYDGIYKIVACWRNEGQQGMSSEQNVASTQQSPFHLLHLIYRTSIYIVAVVGEVRSEGRKNANPVVVPEQHSLHK
jgi:hypothetical protein